jgi:hypothetical protein
MADKFHSDRSSDGLGGVRLSEFLGRLGKQPLAACQATPLLVSTLRHLRLKILQLPSTRCNLTLQVEKSPSILKEGPAAT